MKFVNPKNDVAFRKIFGSQEKSEILISFLNAVLGLTGDREIQSLRILNPYQTPKLEPLKMSILDVKATDKRDVIFIGILDFKLFEKNGNYLSRHQILDTTT